MKRITRVSCCIAVLAAALIPAQPAIAAPAIAFLNPSGYSPTVKVSDADIGAYHFVAWVKDVPSNPLVEFEIVPATGNATTVEASRVGSSEVWQAKSAIPASLADGQYTINARLYSNLDEVANASQIVTLERSNIPPPPAVPSVEIQYPENGGPAGFYAPPAGAASVLVDVKSSEEPANSQVRVLYSTAAPGTAPTWTECGTGAFAGDGRVKCTLGANTQPTQVTALAAVANQAPDPGPANPGLDGSGDAHRVVPYIQVPKSLAVTPMTINRTAVAACTTALTARVTDQLSRPIAAVNVDLHAFGPNDSLRFASIANTTSAFQAPDKAHVSAENAWNCGNNDNGGRQGDHNVVNAPDRKHIESTTGTNNDGGFKFALRSDTAGGTFIEAWADTNNDDVANSNEITGGAQIGWGQDAPQPQLEISLSPSQSSATRGSCQRMELVVREGGNPVAAQNVDIHAAGPDSSNSFCPVSDGSTTRIPDQGDHAAGAHADGTKHIEGETDSTGRFVFGVQSPSEGSTIVTGWLDTTDDDTPSSEPSQTATITWTPPGERSVSLDVNKSSVRSGGTVKLFGSIDGDGTCESGQTVKIKSRRPGRKFRGIGSTTSDSNGAYEMRVKVRRTLEFRAVLPAGGPCTLAKSNIVKVKAN